MRIKLASLPKRWVSRGRVSTESLMVFWTSGINGLRNSADSTNTKRLHALGNAVIQESSSGRNDAGFGHRILPTPRFTVISAIVQSTSVILLMVSLPAGSKIVAPE